MILRQFYECEYEEWDSEGDEDGEWEWVWEDEEESQGEQMQNRGVTWKDYNLNIKYAISKFKKNIFPVE